MNGAHLHLALNHLPVVGVLVALLVLAVALLRGNDTLRRTGLALALAAGLAAGAAYLTGEGAEEVAEDLPGVTETLIERHEDAAKVATIAAAALGVLALGVLVLTRGRPVSTGPTALVFAAALLTGGAMTWTAYLGGQIRHTEIRDGAAAPAGEAGAGGEAHDDD